ncbi:hypothetical protein NLI96_g6378 [Meripilus lineatus]|uniref:Uncharacterized protein n=1 Tax=Meripilus lineatus TaxID=2056292 RepID=A0AAD5YI65_9APHY|nr:hypothetical protein NLI96_g6378 [Physisporinus lineatus]
MSTPLPAHKTKHIHHLQYPFRNTSFHLAQLDNGLTNGTGLWLGGQCLSVYLAHIYGRKQHQHDQQTVSPHMQKNHRPRAIELGSGIGLSALALSSLGWDVLATDLPVVLTSVLSQNIARNIPILPPGSGHLQARVLDWTVPPEKWSWNSNAVIAQSPPPDFDTTSTSYSDSNKQEFPHATIQHDHMTSLDSVTTTASRPQLDADQVEFEYKSRDPATNNNTPPHLAPPFDLIISADTLYLSSLVDPFLRTLHALSVQSLQVSSSHTNSTTSTNPTSPSTSPPPIYLCIERRDPRLMDQTFLTAQEKYNFTVERIPHRKLSKIMGKGGLMWDKSEWEGVEVWKLVLRVSSSSSLSSSS